MKFIKLLCKDVGKHKILVIILMFFLLLINFILDAGSYSVLGYFNSEHIRLNISKQYEEFSQHDRQKLNDILIKSKSTYWYIHPTIDGNHLFIFDTVDDIKKLNTTDELVQFNLVLNDLDYLTESEYLSINVYPINYIEKLNQFAFFDVITRITNVEILKIINKEKFDTIKTRLYSTKK